MGEETGLKEMVQREGGSAPSVSVNASPPEWPINSNYGKEATITRLRGSILNPRTLYSQALFPCLSFSLSLSDFPSFSYLFPFFYFSLPFFSFFLSLSLSFSFNTTTPRRNLFSLFSVRKGSRTFSEFQ